LLFLLLAIQIQRYERGRPMRVLVSIAILAGGCSLHRGQILSGDTAIVAAAIIAAEIALEPEPPQQPLCTEPDIVHTCPSTAAEPPR
jgi:hypothetical protein